MAEGVYAGGRRKLWNPSWHPALAVPCSSWLSMWRVGEGPPLCKADLMAAARLGAGWECDVTTSSANWHRSPALGHLRFLLG